MNNFWIGIEKRGLYGEKSLDNRALVETRGIAQGYSGGEGRREIQEEEDT